MSGAVGHLGLQRKHRRRDRLPRRGPATRALQKRREMGLRKPDVHWYWRRFKQNLGWSLLGFEKITCVFPSFVPQGTVCEYSRLNTPCCPAPRQIRTLLLTSGSSYSNWFVAGPACPALPVVGGATIVHVLANDTIDDSQPLVYEVSEATFTSCVVHRICVQKYVVTTCFSFGSDWFGSRKLFWVCVE